MADINMRDEFDLLMKEYGHAVLLHRTGRKIRCRCFSTKYQEAEAACAFCFGTGWVGRIERHTLRGKSAVQTISRTNLGQQTEIGNMWVDAMTFYMRHDAHPKVGDLVYEVGWRDSQKPSHLIKAYEINDVYPNRMDGGEIIHWTVSLKSRTTNMEIQNILVRAIGPIKNYELIAK